MHLKHLKHFLQARITGCGGEGFGGLGRTPLPVQKGPLKDQYNTSIFTITSNMFTSGPIKKTVFLLFSTNLKEFDLYKIRVGLF